ncbi:hypothetical protein BGZ72_010751 [Mortierella alpina]|nr:hypothetical protein BGZ72_010751 [Mortierella alpina]
MPITINPCERPLGALNTRHSTPKSADYYINSPFDIVQARFQQRGEVFQCSFPIPSRESSAKDLIIPAMSFNGFVDSAMKAYNEHHHLVIRPDDVWIAILSQFSLFVNANAEKLRHLFVAHEGKKELKVTNTGTRYTMDFGNMATQMGKLIQEHVIDPSLRKWIIPDFTTTTADDKIISSVIMMSTLKKDSSVVQPAQASDHWIHQTFNNPNAADVKDFWQEITHRSGGGVPTYLSGWITAFCFFDSDGGSLYNRASLYNRSWDQDDGNLLTLGGTIFHRVDTNDIPAAYADVSVVLDDNGTKQSW